MGKLYQVRSQDRITELLPLTEAQRFRVVLEEVYPEYRWGIVEENIEEVEVRTPIKTVMN